MPTPKEQIVFLCILSGQGQLHASQGLSKVGVTVGLVTNQPEVENFAGFSADVEFTCRGGGIRTPDPLLPKQIRSFMETS